MGFTSKGALVLTALVFLMGCEQAVQFGKKSDQFLKQSLRGPLFVSPDRNTPTLASLFVTGVCESGIPVTIDGDATNLPQTFSCQFGAFGLDINFTSGDGPKVLTASQTYLDGSTDVDRTTYIRDNTGPVISITNPLPGSYVSSSFVVGGDCEAGLLVDVIYSGSSLGTTNCVSGRFSLPITVPAPDGSIAITATQSDILGNSSSVTETFLKDSISPLVSFSSPSENSRQPESFTVTGLCETGLNVLLTGSLAADVTTSCSGGTFSSNITLSAGEGSKQIIARQVDAAGNIGEGERIFIKDTLGPDVLITSPARNSVHRNSVLVSGTCEVGYPVNISGDITSNINTSCVSGSFTASVNLASNDGSKSVWARQTDGVGNIGGDERIFIKDNTAPVVAILTPVAGTVDQSGVTITGSCEAGLSVTVSGSGAQSSQSVSCVSGQFVANVTFSSGDGNKLIQASQTDAVGNTGQDSRSFERDTTAPNIAITGPATNSVFASSFTLTGTCETGLNVAISGAGILGTIITNCLSGTFSADLNFSIGDGTKNVVVAQSDAAGNIGSDNRDFIRDSTAPAVNISSPMAGAVFQNSLDLSGTCETGLDVTINGAGAAAPSTVPCLSGNFSSSISLSSGDGVKTLSAFQTDAAGNTGSDSRDFLRDSAAPLLVVVNPVEGSSYTSTVLVNGQCEDGIDVVVAGSGLSSSMILACVAGSFNGVVDLSVGDGSKLIEFSQTDGAGNSTLVSRNVIRDTTAPIVSIESPDENTETNGSINVSGQCEDGLDVVVGGDLESSETVTCVGGSYSVTVNLSTGDGNKNVIVSQTDAVGNTSSDSRNFILDTVAPSLAILSPLPNFVTARLITLTGSCETGLNVSISGNVSANQNVSCSSGGFSATVTLTGSDGSKNVNATQVDAAGNSTSDSRSFILDTTAPIVSFTSPANGSAQGSSVDVTGSCESGLDVVISGSGLVSGITLGCPSGSFSASLNLTSGDGSKQIRATQTDSVGNSGSANLNVVRDATPPVLAIQSPASGTTTNSSLIISGVCESGLDVSISGDISTPTTTPCSSDSFSSAVTLSGPDGSKTVSVSQVDAFGNSSSDSRSFVLDTTAPTLAIQSPAAGTQTSGSLSINGICTDGYSVVISGDIFGSPAVACTSGTFSVNVDLSGSDGTKVVTASQTDAVGNTSSDSRSFVLDTLAPNMAFLSPASGSVHGATVDVTGSCESGLNVSITGSGILSNQTVSCVSGTFSANLILTNGDGSKNIQAAQTDAVGNVGTAGLMVLRDATPPALAIQNPASGTATSSSLIVSGICETGLEVQYSGDILSSGSVSCLSGAFSFTANLSSPDGSKNITVSQTDAIGNSSSDSRSFVLDTTAPTLAIQSPAAGTLSSGSLNIGGICTDGFPVTVSGDISGSPSTTCSSGTFSVSVDLSGPDGTKSVMVSQTDAVGNTASDSRNFILDSTPPNLLFTLPANGAVHSGTVTVTGICETGFPVTLSGAGIDSGQTLACTSGGFSAVLVLSSGDGNKVIVANQSDSVGNSAQDTLSIFQDSTPPNLAITSPAAGTETSGALVLGGNCETGLDVQVGGDIAVSGSTPCVGGSFSVSISLVGADGNKNVQVSQTDLLGNSSNDSRTFVLDTTAPVIAIQSPSSNTATTGSLVVSGTCTSPFDVNISGDISSSQLVSCSSGSFSATVTLSGSDGVKSVSVSQQDTAGNSASDSRNFLLDTTGPALAFTSPANGSTHISNVTLQGTCETGTDVQVSGSGLASSVTTPCTSNQFSVLVSLSSGDGSKAIQASQSDLLGNSSTDSLTLNRDNTAPVLAIQSPTAGSITSGSIVLSGVCESGLDVSVSGDIVVSGATPCASGSFSVSVSLASPDGSRSVTVSQTDAVGNTSTDSRSFVLDTTAPLLAITSPSDGTQTDSIINLVAQCESGLDVVVSGDLVNAGSYLCVSNTLSLPVQLSSGDGVKAIQLTQTDLAGNSASASGSYILDSMAPIVTIASPIFSDTNIVTHVVSGNCEDGLNVIVSGGGVASPQTVSCLSGSYSATINFSSGDGSKTIIASQTDAVGNSGMDTRTYNLDTIAPIIAITSPAAGTSVSGVVALQGTCESGLSIGISGDTVSPATGTCSGGSFSIDVSLTSGAGTKTVNVSQTDLAGNSGSDSRNFNNNATATESFTISVTDDEVDILFVNDNSASMENQQTEMAARFSSFLAGLGGVDWQIGMTTTDCSAGPYGICGSLLEYEGAPGTTILDPTVANYETLFQDTIQRPETPNCASLGTCPSNNEQGLLASMTSMDKRDSDNTGFFRSNADLAIVILSDEDEMSFSPPMATTASDMISHFKSIWPTGKKLTVFSIIIEPGDSACLNAQNVESGGFSYYGDYYYEAAQLTGGDTGSICDNDYSATLQSIGDDIRSLTYSVELQYTPIPASVLVTLNPVQSIGYTIQANKIILDSPPIDGTQVTVDYSY